MQATQASNSPRGEEGRPEPRQVSLRLPPLRAPSLSQTVPSRTNELTPRPTPRRFFYKCNAANDSDKCKLFKWEEPSDVPSSSSASSSNFPAGGNRLGSSTPRSHPPSTPPRNRLPPATPSRAPASESNKRPRAQSVDSDEGWEQSLVAAEEDATQAAQKESQVGEEDDDIEEPGTPVSPAKRAKFDSFRAVGPSTPSKSAGRGGGGHIPPHADPESPFHARKAALFPSGTPAGSPSSGVAASGSLATVDALLAVVGTLGSLSPQIEALKKDVQRSDRVVVAWGKERETLRRKNTELSDRVK